MVNNISKFLSTLWRGGQYAYYWTAPNRASYWFSTKEVDSHPCPNGGQNVYFGVNPVLQIPDKNAKGQPRQPQAVRSQNKYIGAVNTLFGEFDFKDFGDTDSIRNHLKQFPHPSIAIFSGGGYHFYWLLTNTYLVNNNDDLDYIRGVQANWVNHIGSDKNSKSPQLIRLASFPVFFGRVANPPRFPFYPGPTESFVGFFCYPKTEPPMQPTI